MAQTLIPNGQVYQPLTPPGQSYPEPSHDVPFTPGASLLGNGIDAADRPGMHWTSMNRPTLKNYPTSKN